MHTLVVHVRGINIKNYLLASSIKNSRWINDEIIVNQLQAKINCRVPVSHVFKATLAASDVT